VEKLLRNMSGAVVRRCGPRVVAESAKLAYFIDFPGFGQEFGGKILT
jgi:hypothetical protein